MIKKNYVILVMAVAIFISASPIQTEQRGSHDIDQKIKAEVFRVLDNFMRSFNARDRKAHYETYHFPHYRFASGKMTVLEKPDESDSTIFLERLVQTGWHHTKWNHRNVIQASENKVHIDTQFTRFRNDGSKIKTYESLYILTYEAGRWAIKMRSSFAE